MTDEFKPKTDQRLIELYDEYAHGQIDRREFMRRAGALAVGGVSAAALAQSMLPQYALAQTISFTDPRLRGSYTEYPSPNGSGTVRGYFVRPVRESATPAPGVLVIHENRGLNPYIEDVARRLAIEGFLALAPDGLSTLGGYPGNDDEGREMQARIPAEQLKQDMIAGARFLKGHAECTGKLAAIGFCWGGGMVNTLAIEFGDALDAGVPFYGPQPAASDVARITAPLLIHYGELDTRINAGWAAFETALQAHRIEHTMHMYAGANHGFHNDSTPRYDEQAATLAWDRTVTFLRQHLQA